MSTPSTYCPAVSSAIFELDKTSFSKPIDGPDKSDWNAARKLLFEILNRNGYVFAEIGSRRIKRTVR
jgi:hypothetical protein